MRPPAPLLSNRKILLQSGLCRTGVTWQSQDCVLDCQGLGAQGWTQQESDGCLKWIFFKKKFNFIGVWLTWQGCISFRCTMVLMSSHLMFVSWPLVRETGSDPTFWGWGSSCLCKCSWGWIRSVLFGGREKAQEKTGRYQACGLDERCSENDEDSSCWEGGRRHGFWGCCAVNSAGEGRVPKSPSGPGLQWSTL